MLIFVYGTLMTGFGNNYIISEANLIDNIARTNTPEFDLIDFGGFPALIRKCEDGFFVEGELWNVSSSLIMERLDNLEGHPNFYRRQSITIYSYLEGSGELITEVLAYIIDNPSEYNLPVVSNHNNRIKRWKHG